MEMWITIVSCFLFLGIAGTIASYVDAVEKNDDTEI
jgi:hypothetical protein